MRVSGVAMLTALGVLLIPGSAGAANYAAGDILVASADGGGDSSGAILAVNPFTGAQNVVSTNAMSLAAGGAALMSNPFDVAIEPSGMIVVAEQGAQTNSVNNDGRVIRINPANGAQTLISAAIANISNPPLYDVMGITVSPPGSPNAGDVYFTDEHGQDGTSGDGAVYRIDTVGTGTQSLVSSNAVSEGLVGPDLFRDPQDLVVTAAGTVLVSDDSSGGQGGGIVLVNGNGTHAMYSDNTISPAAGGTASFSDPRHITLAANGADILVANANQVPFGSPNTILRVTPNGAATVASTSASYEFPDGIAVNHLGDIILADRIAFAFGGAIFKASGATVTTIASQLNVPHGITVAPGTPVPPAPAQRILTVSAAGTGAGAGFVTSAPAGIDCGTSGSGRGDCTESYTEGTQVTLTATATNGTFTGYSAAVAPAPACVRCR